MIKEPTIKIEDYMINEVIIEVEATAEDLEIMRADVFSESELPSPGIKKYRSSRYILKDKVRVLLDADIVEHFGNTKYKEDKETYQTNINQTLRQVIESEKRVK